MLKTLKQIFQNFWKNTNTLFVRKIPGSEMPEPKESTWKALMEFLTRYPRYILGLIIVAIFPFVLAFIFFLFLTATRPSLTVPQLEGLSLTDAASIIQKQKISISIIPEVSHKYPQNYIIHQDIKAGRSIKEGRTLLLYVSTGATELTFPSFVGKNFYDVKMSIEHEALSMKTFQINSISWQNSTKPFGEILFQSPQGGSYSNFPISVSFVLSNGSSQALPSFIGMYSLQAAYSLEKLGVTPQLAFEKTSDPNMDGRVLRQTPTEATVLFPKMTVRLFIAQYNPDVKYFHYSIPQDLDGKTIGLVINDNRGQKILFLGLAKVGESIEAASPLYGDWKAGIYIYDTGNNKTLYKDLNI